MTGHARDGAAPRSKVVQRAPGGSITRRRKPPDADCPDAERNAARPPAPAAPPAKILQARVDALTIGFNGRLSEAFRSDLAAALDRAHDAGVPKVEIDVGAFKMALDARSRAGWWQMQNAEAAVKIAEQACRRGWILEVAVRAMMLAAIGPLEAAARADALASAILEGSEAYRCARVMRVDLCADLVGLDLRSVEPTSWVGRGRAKTRKLTPEVDGQQFFVGGERTAFYVGKNALMLRVYDKTLELKNDLGGEKRASEHARWRAAGWNGLDDVTRVEFQIQGKTLDEIDDGRLRDPARLADRLDPVWAFLTNEWVRLCVPDSATRRTRWTTDPRWGGVQSASFGAPTGEIAPRSRRRGVPSPKYVAAIVLAYGAKTRTLDLGPVPLDAREVLSWSSERARDKLDGMAERILGDVARGMTADMVALAGGPQAALQRFIEWLRAIRAKAWTELPPTDPGLGDTFEGSGTFEGLFSVE